MEESLHKYGIFNFYYKEGELYVKQNVDISGSGLSELPFKIHTIHGDFSLTGNHFVTTKGFPKFIEGNANMSYNRFEHFEEFPHIEGSLILDSNSISSLRGINVVKTTLSICNNTHLASLSYAPVIENYDDKKLFCYDTSLDEIEIKVYKECLKLGVWDSSKTTYENAIHTKLLNEYNKINMKKFGL